MEGAFLIFQVFIYFKIVKNGDCCQNCDQVTASLYQCCFIPQITPNQINPLTESKVTCSNKKAKSNNKKECLKDSPNGKMESCCETCFRTNVPLKKCSKCKTTYYCSNDCQKYDWPTHKSNCKASKMNTEVKYEKESGHEYSKERSNKKDPVKENSVSIDDGDGSEVDNKVGSKNKKKRNRRKKCKNVNGVNIENDGATSKTDVRDEINKKDSATKARKGNTGNMNYKGKDGGRDSEKESSKKRKSKKKTVQVKSKEDIKKTGTINTGKKSDARTSVKNTGNFLLKFLLNIWRFLIYIIYVIFSQERRPKISRRYIKNIGRIENIDNFQKAVLKDTEGRICSLIFYHKESDPYPYFSWDQLKVGKYICILEPEIHYFLDGQ
ncbi:rho GTPase-activating protein gacZ, partial [Octopus bimaculoides]